MLRIIINKENLKGKHTHLITVTFLINFKLKNVDTLKIIPAKMPIHKYLFLLILF